MNFSDNTDLTGRDYRQTGDSGMYKEFDATELYCPRCGEATPVRKRLLLVLPDGDLYEYRCAFCAESVGTKTDRGGGLFSAV